MQKDTVTERPAQRELSDAVSRRLPPACFPRTSVSRLTRAATVTGLRDTENNIRTRQRYPLIRESLAPLRGDMMVVSEELRIPSDTPGIELSLHHKRPKSATTFGAERTIVIVHGATYSSGSLYDVPLGGFSFLDYLADGGYDVYALDVRGDGRSSRPHEMEEPGDRNPPRIDTATGVRDLATAVDTVLTRN